MNTNLRIKHTNGFSNFSKKFTIEFWGKIANINVTLFTKESLQIEIQNGEFIVNYQNKTINASQNNKINCDIWTHFCFTYRRKTAQLKVFLNCEETAAFNLTVGEELGLRGDINIGCSNLDAELTEIKIWKEEMPMKFIKEYYKSPLPILWENKRKLRMKISKQDDNATGQSKKKFEFGKNIGSSKFYFKKFRACI